MWHSYKPDDLTGWHEHWVGFAGTGVEQVFHPGLLKRKTPVIPIREEKIMLDSFHHLFQSVREGTARAEANSGWLDKRSSGASLLLDATAFGEGQKRDPDHRAGTIPDARRADPRHPARSEHTGASPHQYRLHLKISAARELLRSTDLRQGDQLSMRVR
jgi:hypothetical protein